MADEVRKAAMEIANEMVSRLTDRERELADIEKRKAEIQAECDAIRSAPKRLANFPVKKGIDYLCPRCWVEEGKTIPLSPIPSPTRDDNFRCLLCRFEITVSY